MADNSKIMAFIATCEDQAKLKQLVKNAKAKSDKEVEQAAFKRLISIAPGEKPGTLEHDLWRTIHAFEHVLSEEKGKTVRLSRTRQKLDRVGVAATLEDWALGKPTDGFNMLMDRGLPELTGEAIVLRHSGRFSPDTVVAARKRLVEIGVDPDSVSSL